MTNDKSPKKILNFIEVDIFKCWKHLKTNLNTHDHLKSKRAWYESIILELLNHKNGALHKTPLENSDLTKKLEINV